MRRAQQGERGAFDALVALHGRLVLSIARRILGDGPDAEDAAQEAFLRLYKAIGKVDPERPFEPWVVRVAVNAARSARAGRPARREEALDVDPAATGAEHAPDGALARRQLRAAIDEAKETLPRREREIFVLRDEEGLPVETIAAALGLSDVTVRRHSTEARRRLAAWLRANRPELLR